MLYRTKKFNEFLRRIAERNKKFWRTYANIGVVAAVIEMFVVIYLLSTNIQRFLYSPTEATPITPLLPGVTIDFRWFPYILIAASVAITIHEMAHGIISFSENIPVKSSGIVLAPITFGGFVEPDEDVFKKTTLSAKLRVLAVGSFTNIVAGILVLLLLFAIFVPFSGVLVMTVSESGPAYTARMRPWEVIYQIEGNKISNVEEFLSFMRAIGPGITLTFETSGGIRNIITGVSAENASKGIIGISDFLTHNSIKWGEMNPQFSYHLFMTLNWTSMLLINVAVFNMLPLFPFDGEACVYSFLREKLKRGLRNSRIIINAIALVLLVSNVGLTFIRYGLTPF
ncbi:MAG: site-2 protease family protein [Candidatus Bathyarchaeota archaeon]